MGLGGFGGKTFEVSSEKINTFSFEGLSNKHSLKVEEQEVEGSKPSIYVKGFENNKPTIEIILNSQNGVNVKKEYDDWKELLYSESKHMLFIGDYQVSENKFMLKEIEPSEYMYSPYGELIKLKLKLTFLEFPRAGAKKEENKKESNKKTTKKKTTKKKKKIIE